MHGEDISAFDATLGPVPASDKLAPVEGVVNGGSTSLASIGTDSSLRLYLQLGSANNKQNLRQTADANKVLLTFKIKGLVDDDDSAPVQLVKPEAPVKGAVKTKP